MSVLQKFFILQVSAIFLHTACAVYAFLTPFAFDSPLELAFYTVEFTNATYYKENETFTFNIPSVILFHGIVAIVTVLFHLFVYTPIYHAHAHMVWKQGYFTARWFEYAVTCTLMTVASSVSSGTEDATTVILIVCCGVALQCVGLAIEQLKAQWKLLFFIGATIETASTFNIAWYTVSTQATLLQWIEFLSYGFFYSLFAINCVSDAIWRRSCFVKTDWYYNVFSLTSKFGIFWMQVGEIERKHVDGAWPEIQVFFLGIAFPFFLLALGWWFQPICVEVEPVQTKYFISWKKLAGLRFTEEIKPEIVYVTRRSRYR